MVRLISENGSHQFGSLPLAIGLFISVAAMVALCAKHSRRASKELENKVSINSEFTAKSPLVSPKKLVTTIGNKANPSMYKKKGGDESEAEIGGRVSEGGFGEGGLWQKGILMGDRCRPPEFSGVIHYDNSGNKLSELPPRSPRGASPLPSFLFPDQAKGAN